MESFHVSSLSCIDWNRFAKCQLFVFGESWQHSCRTLVSHRHSLTLHVSSLMNPYQSMCIYDWYFILLKHIIRLDIFTHQNSEDKSLSFYIIYVIIFINLIAQFWSHCVFDFWHSFLLFMQTEPSCSYCIQ